MVMAAAEVATPLRPGRRPQGDQALLTAHHAVPRDAHVALHIVAVRDVEAHAIDVDVGTPGVGDVEVDVIASPNFQR